MSCFKDESADPYIVQKKPVTCKKIERGNAQIVDHSEANIYSISESTALTLLLFNCMLPLQLSPTHWKSLAIQRGA